MSSLTIIVIIQAFKWPHMKIFMIEDANILLGCSKLASMIDRTILSTPIYEEGESDSRKVEDCTKSPKALQRI